MDLRGLTFIKSQVFLNSQKNLLCPCHMTSYIMPANQSLDVEPATQSCSAFRPILIILSPCSAFPVT
jgi:hypothetical protein